MKHCLGYWVEAMRLRTLPVSVAGVVAGVAMALEHSCFRLLPALLCLVFATLAQVASNFANEYYDYRDGLDTPGRVGPRRGVTEGDISPRAMLAATYLTLGAALAVGLSLLLWGSVWLVAAGVAIGAGAVAYSAGPWPLSRHGLGEVAVLFFFGIIPVNLTYYLQSGTLWQPDVFMISVAMGLLGANVLVVNNYRDIDDDRASGKTTLAVMLGRRAMAMLYLVNGLAAVALTLPWWMALEPGWLAAPAAVAAVHCLLWARLRRSTGRSLNPQLGMTSMLMALYSVLILLASL